MTSLAARRLFVRLTLVAGLSGLFASSPAFAQRDLKDIPTPDPELERQLLQVADGFEINLYAADPMLAKPIQMNFDPQGRLWVASSEVYPHIKPGEKANDKILILEDADGDGRAEKTTVFADGLLIPTGVAPGDGGAYVANSTELVHLRDTDGDGKADTSRVMLSGFGTEDTHHILHTFRWGPDGNFYFNQSIYIHSHIETPHGPRRLNAGGIWQFCPETMQLEVFARGWVNSWGHDFDQFGQSFATDGAGSEGINYFFPGAAFAAAADMPRILPGLNPGSPKHCGLELISGRHMPDAWQGNAITNDFRAHRVCRFVLSENGSGFVSTEQPELVKSTHVAFRPVDVKMGPDGAIYIADWYNPIIQHGEVDFRDPRRDKTHGRIWRITAKGRPLVPRPKLVGASTADLLKALQAPENYTRMQAKRVLKERGPEVLKEIPGWLAQLDPDDPNLDRHKLEALWTYQALRQVEPQLLTELLASKDGHIRAAATRVLGMWADQLPDAVNRLAPLAKDEFPRVRLEATRAAARVPQLKAAAIALAPLDKPQDMFLDYALWLSARDLQHVWLPAVARGDFDFGNMRHLTFALQAAATPAVVEPLLKLVRDGKVPADQLNTALNLVAEYGNAAQLATVFDLALQSGGDTGRQTALLESLVRTAAQRKIAPEGDRTRLKSLLESNDANVRTLAARAVGHWKVAALQDDLRKLASDPKTPAGVRRGAIEGLAGLGGKENQAFLIELARNGHDFETRAAAVSGMAISDLSQAAPLGIELLGAAKPSDDSASVFRDLLNREQGIALFTAALAGKKLPAPVAEVGAGIVRGLPSEQPALLAAINTAGGIQGGPRKWSDDEVKSILDEVRAKGDPARGEIVYRRENLQCMKCHAIGGVGGRVGPDLISIGASAQPDYLLQSLLVPSAKVKEGYQTLIVRDEDDKVTTGVLVRSTDKELILRDAEDREIRIPHDVIEGKKDGGSLMPSGLVDNLSRQELVDLVRYLSELGKVGPFAVSKTPTLRRWETLIPSKAIEDKLKADVSVVVSNDQALQWASRYSKTNGELPLSDIPTHRPQATASALAIVRGELEVTKAGKIKLVLNSPQGVRMWVDDKPLEVSDDMTTELTAGKHRVTIAVTSKARQEPLLLQLFALPDGGQAQFLGGK